MAIDTNKKLNVAIIMDGNGRWAEARGLIRSKGHDSGAKRVKAIILHAGAIRVKKLSFWAFSTDNWNRPEYEVTTLMTLLRKFIVQEADELQKRNVHVTFIGERTMLPQQLQRVMENLETATRLNDGLHLEIAINYGGRDEIVRATKAIMRDGLDPDEVTEEVFSSYLDTSGEPDLIIRTSGENRTSGFMPFQATSAEWYFEPDPWPDYTPEHFDRALAAYANRDRRFGGLSKQAV